MLKLEDIKKDAQIRGLEGDKIVDMTNLSFSFDGSPVALAGTNHYFPPTVLRFTNALDLLLYLAGNGAHKPEIQNAINRRLKEDSVVKVWHLQRTFLKDLKHFPKYKGAHYDTYHRAARSLATGTGTIKQQLMVDGLNREISASNVVAPIGQVVFHGRSDLAMHSLPSYPSFVSTSLDPIVAVNSALRRGGLNQVNGRPVVYILTLREPLHVIWGNGGKPHEWELLLQTNLMFSLVKMYSGTLFDIVQATAGH
jgi:hypothetical protein